MDLLFLKPHCVGLNLLWVSKNQASRVLTNFSTTLPTHDSREIGRYELGSVKSFPAFGMGITRDFFQLLGISAVLKLLFANLSNSVILCAGRFFRNLLCTSSSPVTFSDGKVLMHS